MTDKEAEYIVKLFRELNANRDAYYAIDRDELFLHVSIGSKAVPIAYLLSDDQRLDIEVQVRDYLYNNMIDIKRELDSMHITIEMLEGR